MSFATTTVTAPAISFFATISCIAGPMPARVGSPAKADRVRLDAVEKTSRVGKWRRCIAEIWVIGK